MYNVAPLGSLPVGLAMAIAENPKALHAFSALSLAEQNRLIRSARLARSRDEMQALVQGLCETARS